MRNLYNETSTAAGHFKTMADSHAEFDDLLDNALDDFGKLELGSASKVVTDENSGPVQGLGTGLPNLPPNKKKGK